eukprot:14465662-Alexandrium_andersonii.AAC.1
MSSSPRGTPPTTSAAGDDGAAPPASTVGVMGAATLPEAGLEIALVTYGVSVTGSVVVRPRSA